MERPRPAAHPPTCKERPAANDLPLRPREMKDANRDNEGNISEDSPVWPPVTCTPEQRRMIRKGVRIWAKVAIRSYMRKQAAGPRLRSAVGRRSAVESRDDALPFDAVGRYTLRYGIW